jgi:rhamnogalacturonan endolyase
MNVKNLLFIMAVCLTLMLTFTCTIPQTSKTEDIQIASPEKATTATLQAENAVISGGSVASSYSGYSGTGYADMTGTSGACVEFTVNATAAGSASIKIYYANGTGSSITYNVTVNGSGSTKSFSSGAWTTWSSASRTVTLVAGSNTIKLTATAATTDGVNFDRIEVTGDVSAASSVAASSSTTAVSSSKSSSAATSSNSKKSSSSTTVVSSSKSSSAAASSAANTSPASIYTRQAEKLDRGLVAVKVSSGVYLSWRILGTEFNTAGYNVYRNSTKIATISASEASNYTDTSGTTSSTYTVKAVINGTEQSDSTSTSVWSDFYKTISLSVPSGGTSPDDVAYTYSPNDCSVGDLNGDGQYEIVVKWDPSNSKDNSLSGYTGNVYLDAYTLSGTKMWRIDLGKNIRAGAHYTQFLVYDFDGDGKAEVVCKTADGTKDGAGTYIGSSSTDNRNSSGYILSGSEYLTVFKGSTGTILKTISYEPARGTVSAWGDSYGNRVDRFLACVAYLDGKTPSIVMCRGYYTRAYLVAYKWDGSSLTKQWAFDSNNNTSYAGQGNHNLCVGDVDGDGYDEIVYGACTIDHNGSGLYSTGLGHGDALHLGDFNPGKSGLEVWQAHEGGSGATFRSAKSGSVYWTFSSSADVGRGMCADVDATNKGAECWASGSGLYSCTGSTVSSSQPASDNFGIWWDGDDLREILDGTKLDKYGTGRLVTLYNYESGTACNGTKNTPNLQADILGDWREEVILHSSDNSKLIIFTTTTSTSRRLFTLMHDPMYRLGIAWQNVAYNQPPDVSFYLGGGMSTPPTPNIYYP